jgi:hypothetical protein
MIEFDVCRNEAAKAVAEDVESVEECATVAPTRGNPLSGAIAAPGDIRFTFGLFLFARQWNLRGSGRARACIGVRAVARCASQTRRGSGT